MSDVTDTPQSDEKVAHRKIVPGPSTVEDALTGVISEVENHRSILKSQANAILAVVAFLCLFAVAYNRETRALRALLEEAANAVA